jgi:hypothetical protein
MPQGVPTPEHQVAEFRAHYLYSGNASESARAVELDERTGRDLARRLVEDPEFTAARRQLRASALEELVASRMRVATKALERFESDTGGIDVREFGGEDASVTITDKRADYGRLVLDAEKNAHNLAKFDAEKSGEIPAQGTVTIHVSPTPEAAQRLSEDAAAGKKPGG